MTLSEALHRVLHLTLFWWRQDKQGTLLDGRDSTVTPLGQLGYRRLNTDAKLEDGIERARNRSYATRECKRLQK